MSPSLSTFSPQETVESNEVTPQPLSLQSRQAFMRHVFQPFQQLCCSTLDTSKDLSVLLKLWGPELCMVLQTRLHQS